ncbi:MAG TPA: hypothetical protein PLT75_10850 [Spirochaetota bacterium]|nr:hypothetical protein [Spirochaetota bacterium]
MSGKSIISLLLVIMFIVGMILMNNALLRYRQDEIVYNLNILSHEMNDYKSFGLIGRYLLIQKRLEQGEERANDLIMEARLQHMLRSISSAARSSTPESSFSLNSITSPAVKYYIRGLSFLHGKESPADMSHAYNNPFLELSYFFERHRKWNKALRVMGKVFEGNEIPPEPAYRYVLLHSGFCYAMLSQNDAAGISLYHLINTYPGTPEADTARKLLGVLHAIKKGVQKILSGNAAPEVKGEQLYLLSSYTHALQQYNLYFKAAGVNHPSFFKSLYFRGRTYEELGDNAHAMNDFREILSKRPESPWARKANRRVYMIGTVYGGNRQLAASSIQQSRHYKDQEVFTTISELQAKRDTREITPENAEKQFQELFSAQEQPVPGQQHIPVIHVKAADTPSPDITVQDIPGFAEKVKSSITSWYSAPSKNAPEYSEITTTGGFRLRGIIIQKNEKKIVLKTEFGSITLNTSSIKGIERINK